MEVSEFENFATTIVSEQIYSSLRYELSGISSSTTYYWKTGSMNVCNEIRWSDTWSFTTAENMGINDPKLNDAVKFYPNPASDILYLEGIENELTQVSVCSMEGKLLKLMNETGITQVDLTGLQKGIYLLKITNAKLTYTSKFIKQ